MWFGASKGPSKSPGWCISAMPYGKTTTREILHDGSRTITEISEDRRLNDFLVIATKTKWLPFHFISDKLSCSLFCFIMAQADDLVSIEYVESLQRNCFIASLKRKQLFLPWNFEVQKYVESTWTEQTLSWKNLAANKKQNPRVNFFRMMNFLILKIYKE